jgi:hypothetical protein
MARQGDVARVEQRQHVPEQIGLGLFADFVADAVPVERFSHELAAVVVANNLADAIALEQSGKVVDHGQFRDLTPHIRRLFDAYGPQRCYWGTDMTNGFTKATYKQRITHFTEELPFLSEQNKDWIMGRAIVARLGWT